MKCELAVYHAIHVSQAPVVKGDFNASWSFSNLMLNYVTLLERARLFHSKDYVDTVISSSHS